MEEFIKDKIFHPLAYLGLSTKEIYVYNALIQLGPTTTGQIIKKTGIPSSKIYQILDSLTTKGFISYTISANKKNFMAADPEILLKTYSDKIKDMQKVEIEVKEAIKELSKIRYSAKKPYEINVFEGVKGIKTLQESILNNLSKGEKIYIVGSPPLMNPSLTGYFKDYNSRRAKKGVIQKVIKNHTGRKTLFLENFSNTQVKYMPEGMDMPALFQTFKDQVCIGIYEPFPIMFVIKNKKIAESFKSYFDLMWKIAKK
ncbi:MAG: helix-turn-helix domain-containing protein [Nanoarchaeota archaeon]|nr:helix-turn-helix domain-containing protein [Nanoarchaeota archaeon]